MEDSDIFADIVMETLGEEGYTVQRAVNGFEGMKLVYSFMPHLIITDVEMPLFKGYQVTRLLKSRKATKNIPVIMLTSLGETKDKFWGRAAGADLYMEKSPQEFAALKTGILRLLADSPQTDYAAVEREGRRINDAALIEMVNNLLDTRLFQTTVIGLLAGLSGTLEEITQGVLDLLHNMAETEIVSVMMQGSDNSLYVYTANFSGYSQAAVDDFNGISGADFAGLFPDYKAVTKHTMDFFPAGDRNKQIESYMMFPLSCAGKKFASLHIANSIKEYFSQGILENLNVFLAAAAPIIAGALSAREMAELQKKTRTAFARYVPADVMDEIIRGSSSVSAARGETRNITILFSDIRDFTRISENTGAQDVVSFLNGFFAAMGNKILPEGGHIDKFIGDAIMAIFGASRAADNAPLGAIRAAVKMLAALKSVDTSQVHLPVGGLRIGIGINCGECVVGNIGFRDKMDYTVIGDTVNLASRLEGLTKQYHHPLIVSEYMYHAAREHFVFRNIDKVRVKGKDEPVEIYAVYTGFENTTHKEKETDTGAAPELLINQEVLDTYNKGIQLYRLREWETAAGYFRRALEINPGDYLSRLYLERGAENLKNPPPPAWDGSVSLAEK
jgi:class 3 adenylate cyclase/DNA-binding response OmpR family regulator